MKCKNCGHEDWEHKYRNRVGRCGHNRKLWKRCDCKQFIPSEDENIKLIDRVEAHYERTKNKGCVRYCVNCLPDGNPSDECKIYGHQYEIFKSPSCSNHSRPLVDKEPEKTVSKPLLDSVKFQSSGSPFKLSDGKKELLEQFRNGNLDISAFIELNKGLDKEFIRLLKNILKDHQSPTSGDISADFVLEEIDKLLGEFK